MPVFLLLFFLLLSICGCTTTIREIQPNTTATEQYLISQSADAAASKIHIAQPQALGLVYIDPTNFNGTQFTLSSIQRALLESGVALTSSDEKADTICYVAVGVQSTDNRVINIGIPALPLPTPAGVNLQTPALPVLSKDKTVGVTLLSLVFLNKQTGKLELDGGESIGLSYNTIWSGVVGTFEHNDFKYRTVP